MARPSKLTPELQQRLIQAISIGSSLASACAYAGVSYKVFREWMIRGERESSGKYCEFREAVRHAEARTEIELVAAWRSHCKTNWRACAEFLSRRFPDRWSPSHTVKLEVQKELEKTLEGLASVMPSSEYASLLYYLSALENKCAD